MYTVYAEGADFTWLGDVKCEGSETSIDECQHGPWGVKPCTYGDIVYINCSPGEINCVITSYLKII